MPERDLKKHGRKTVLVAGLLLVLTSCNGNLPMRDTSFSIDLGALLEQIPLQRRSAAFAGPSSSDSTRERHQRPGPRPADLRQSWSGL